MKIIIAFLFGLALLAQEPIFLVHWQTVEKCYECMDVYAVACAPNHPGCGTPLKTVDHYDRFKDKKEAIAFINGGFVAGLVTVEHSSGFWAGPGSPVEKKFVAFYQLKPIPLKIIEERKEIPQAPVVQKTLKVEEAAQ